jgi:hypothetical protein
MSNPYKVFVGITLGVILADLVTHPETVDFMTLQIQLYAENRCIRCRYKLDHPFVKHESPWWGHYAIRDETRADSPSVVSGMDT